VKIGMIEIRSTKMGKNAKARVERGIKTTLIFTSEIYILELRKKILKELFQDLEKFSSAL
jgi:hypothetical protein